MFTKQEYAEELSYLEEYVRDDWLGFSVITGTAAKLLGGDYSRETERLVCLRIVGDLLDLGARAGDLTDGPDRPFQPRSGDRAEVLSRIEAELSAMERSPESGDICWLSLD